ncbi:MAG TPA: hypothetical protein VME47_03285 [Acetobacteraceae bacterium]|nr:hypothetical protein [Acetobacteraceae bacterium]
MAAVRDLFRDSANTWLCAALAAELAACGALPQMWNDCGAIFGSALHAIAMGAIRVGRDIGWDARLIFRPGQPVTDATARLANFPSTPSALSATVRLLRATQNREAILAALRYGAQTGLLQNRSPGQATWAAFLGGDIAESEAAFEQSSDRVARLLATGRLGLQRLPGDGRGDFHVVWLNHGGPAQSLADSAAPAAPPSTRSSVPPRQPSSSAGATASASSVPPAPPGQSDQAAALIAAARSGAAFCEECASQALESADG